MWKQTSIKEILCFWFTACGGLFLKSNLLSIGFSVIGDLCNLLQMTTDDNFLKTCLPEMNKRKMDCLSSVSVFGRNGVTFSNVWPTKILFLLLHNSLDCIVQLWRIYLIKPHLIMLRHEFHTVYCLYVFIIKTYIYDHLRGFFPPNICSHYSFNLFSNCFKEIKNLCLRKKCSVWKFLWFLQIMRQKGLWREQTLGSGLVYSYTKCVLQR